MVQEKVQDKYTNFNYAKVLKSIAKGNKRALQQLYEQESSLMLSFAFKVLHHHNLAQETLIDTFALVWENAKYFDEEQGAARGWLYCIFRYRLNVIIKKNFDTLKEHNKDKHPFIVGDECQNLHAGVHEFIEPGSFDKAFEELPEETQSVLLSMYFSGQSQAQTATLLNMPLGRLKENIQLGLRHLSQQREVLNVQHDDIISIGEFVLGGLTKDENERIVNLFANDLTAEKLSLIWEEEFLQFLKQLSPDDVPESIWVRIKQAIIPEQNSPVDEEELADELALTQAQGENPDGKKSLTQKLKRYWISRRFWRYLSALLAALLVATIFLRPFENPVRQVAVLHSSLQKNEVGFVVEQAKQLILTPIIQQNTGDSLDLQLWQRESTGLTRPLALLNAKQSTIVTAGQGIRQGDTLFISIEPKGGSQTGQISGQILYEGAVVNLK